MTLQKSMSFFTRTLTLFLSLLLFSACTSTDTSGDSISIESGESSSKIQVYTSFYGMYDFTKKIAGEYADVYNLVPPGTEPHDWEPSTGDMKKLENADLLIYNGAGFESWVGSLEKSLSYSNLVFVEASQNIPLLENHDHDDHGSEDNHNHESIDPHVWLDPANVKIEMQNITDALKIADPKNASYYESNLGEQLILLDDLGREMDETAALFNQHEIIVAHEAYGYLCERMGITQYGIEGIAADSEPSPARMAELSTLAKEKNIRFIFFETLVSPKTAQSLAKEVGIEARQLDPFEGPASAEDNTYDYYSVMRQNLSVLKEALQ